MFTLPSRFAVELHAACASRDAPGPVPLGSLREDQEYPGQSEVTSGRHVAPLLLLPHTRLGHPLVTSGTRPPEDNRSDERPETRASGILRFKVGKCIKTENHAISSILRHQLSHT